MGIIGGLGNIFFLLILMLSDCSFYSTPSITAGLSYGASSSDSSYCFKRPFMLLWRFLFLKSVIPSLFSLWLRAASNLPTLPEFIDWGVADIGAGMPKRLPPPPDPSYMLTGPLLPPPTSDECFWSSTNVAIILSNFAFISPISSFSSSSSSSSPSDSLAYCYAWYC